MATEDTRQHLISVAARLFARSGYFATGIDQIVEESRIAKTTLYRHFPSKEDLIVAVLTEEDAQLRAESALASEMYAEDPENELLAAFDSLAEWISTPGFNGCMFVGAASEFGDRRSRIFRAASLHKKWMTSHFQKLLTEAGFKNAKDIAEKVEILYEGAIAVAHVSGIGKRAATDAKAIVKKLLSTEAKSTTK